MSVSTEEHHTRLSDLGFHFDTEDLPIVNDYAGDWRVTNPEFPSNNLWVVTTDGCGHNVSGTHSPQQVLDIAKDIGWQVAYVAPYGHYVEGELDGVKLHDWILEGRHKRKHEQDDRH